MRLPPSAGRRWRCMPGGSEVSVDDYETLSTRQVFDGYVVRLYVDEVRQPDGKVVEREVVRHWGAVGIVALDGAGNIYMVKQYRHAPGEVLHEIPAGKLLPGEDPLACAQRELKEEVGAKAARWTFLCRFYTSPGFSDEVLHLYLAEDLTEGESCPEEDEFLEVYRVGLDEALRMIDAGVIRDSKTIVGITLASRKTPFGVRPQSE
jgi:ADP-ribose pyrophosphatase